MATSLSMDLRERIVSTYLDGGVSYADVAEQFCVSESSVGKLVRQYRREKCLKPHTDRCGRKRCIRGAAEDALVKHVNDNPDATAEERRVALGLTCCTKTVWLSMKRLDSRFKKSHSEAQSRTARM